MIPEYSSVCEMSGSHGGQYPAYSLLGCLDLHFITTY
jgi:hypothetical protein